LQREERAVRMKIYLGESDQFEGKPAYQAVVHRLRERGIWGATVTRGIYGYGRRSLLHSASILRLSEDLPLIIEAVDSEKKLHALVPELSQMVRGGLITTEEILVVRHIG
jgi:PII-like signaling protein